MSHETQTTRKYSSYTVLGANATTYRAGYKHERPSNKQPTYVALTWTESQDDFLYTIYKYNTE